MVNFWLSTLPEAGNYYRRKMLIGPLSTELMLFKVSDFQSEPRSMVIPKILVIERPSIKRNPSKGPSQAGTQLLSSDPEHHEIL